MPDEILQGLRDELRAIRVLLFLSATPETLARALKILRESPQPVNDDIFSADFSQWFWDPRTRELRMQLEAMRGTPTPEIKPES